MAAGLPRHWIDGFAFGTAVLGGGANPWAEPGQLGLFCRDLTRLLGLEVVDLDLAPCIRLGLGLGLGLELAGGEGRVPLATLATLFADRAWQAGVGTALGAVAATCGGRPLALALPGIGVLLRDLVEDDGDDFLRDDLGLELANLVRAVATPAVRFVMVRECDADALALYEPLANVVGDRGMILLGTVPGAAPAAPGFHGLYAGSGGAGAILSGAFWSGGAPDAAAPLFTTIPADAAPEAVQDARRRLPP